MVDYVTFLPHVVTQRHEKNSHTHSPSTDRNASQTNNMLQKVKKFARGIKQAIHRATADGDSVNPNPGLTHMSGIVNGQCPEVVTSDTDGDNDDDELLRDAAKWTSNRKAHVGRCARVLSSGTSTPVSVRLPRTREDGGLLKRHARRDRDVGFKMEGIGEGFTSYGETV